MFLDKYNGSSNVFFNGLVQGVMKMEQEEGGSPSAPEMSFFYELGISEFISNVADLLRCNSSNDPSQDGLSMGYIDDLYWAAPFEKMIQVIAFVQSNGPKYGYKLNLKKSVYLMSPSPNATTQKYITRVNAEKHIYIEHHCIITRRNVHM